MIVLKNVIEILRSKLASMATDVMLLSPPPGEQAAKMIPMACSGGSLKTMHIRNAVCRYERKQWQGFSGEPWRKGVFFPPWVNSIFKLTKTQLKSYV